MLEFGRLWVVACSLTGCAGSIYSCFLSQLFLHGARNTFKLKVLVINTDILFPVLPTTTLRRRIRAGGERPGYESAVVYMYVHVEWTGVST